MKIDKMKNLSDQDIKSLSRKSIYDPFVFWNSLKNPNRKITKENKEAIESIRQIHIGYISKNIKDDKKILDYGCGVGRLLDSYNVDKHKVVGADISLIYKDIIMEKVTKMGLDFKWVHIPNNKLPYDDNYFDTAVCMQVLMHTQPTDILDIMNELKRVAKKVIISAKEGSGKHNEQIGTGKVFKGHSYYYNYDKLCKKYGFEIFNIERYGSNIQFCYN